MPPASLHELRGFYTSHGLCMVHAWSICQTCAHPRTFPQPPQPSRRPPGRRDDTQQPPCSAATFRAAATFAVLTVLAVMHTLHSQMWAKHVPLSLAAQHIMNSSGGIHETRRSGSIHLCPNATSPSLPKPCHPSRLGLSSLVHPHATSAFRPYNLSATWHSPARTYTAASTHIAFRRTTTTPRALLLFSYTCHESSKWTRHPS